MKRNLAIALLALSTVGTASTVLAQAPGVKAAVPFDFTVGDKTLPAGNYTITASSSGFLQLQNFDRNVKVSAAGIHGAQQPGHSSSLLFYKYGGQYFLHQVVCPSTSQLNVNLPASKREKRVQDEEAKLGAPEEILVAAK